MFGIPGYAVDEEDRPWMKLTARDSGTGYYAWTEQLFDGSGVFVDRPGGRAGTVNGLSGATATKLPAIEMNGKVITTFPWYVRAERAIESATVGVYYRFGAPIGSVGLSLDELRTGTTSLTGGGTYSGTADTFSSKAAGTYLLLGAATADPTGIGIGGTRLNITINPAGTAAANSPSSYTASDFGGTTTNQSFATVTVATYLSLSTGPQDIVISYAIFNENGGVYNVSLGWSLHLWRIS